MMASIITNNITHLLGVCLLKEFTWLHRQLAQRRKKHPRKSPSSLRSHSWRSPGAIVFSWSTLRERVCVGVCKCETRVYFNLNQQRVEKRRKAEFSPSGGERDFFPPCAPWRRCIVLIFLEIFTLTHWHWKIDRTTGSVGKCRRGTKRGWDGGRKASRLSVFRRVGKIMVLPGGMSEVWVYGSVLLVSAVEVKNEVSKNKLKRGETRWLEPVNTQ